ncbi:DNA topoisomerase I [Amphritea sp. HPY]|uniref:DNA topoisomerase I n=1 Tax=Amphritea sp. HPY TaxID=3421652 RepID=UPI003D7EBFF7
MLQDNLIFIIIIAAVGLTALLINFFIASKEQREERRIKRLNYLQHHSEDALNTLAVLREANCREEIIEKISQYTVKMIEDIALLAPESPILEQISTQKENTDRLSPVPGGFSNDRSLKRVQIYIQHAEKILIEMTKQGFLAVSTAKQFQQDLYWLHVTVFADAHIAQGNHYLERDDKLIAMSHYKHAKAIITRTNVPQRKKQPHLDHIRTLLNKARPSSALAASTLASSLAELKQDSGAITE